MERRRGGEERSYRFWRGEFCHLSLSPTNIQITHARGCRLRELFRSSSLCHEAKSHQHECVVGGKNVSGWGKEKGALAAETFKDTLTHFSQC